MAMIPILSFPLDGRDEQFGVLVKCSIFIFLLIINDLGKKNKPQNALVEHLRKTEECVTFFLPVGRFCLTVRKHTIFFIYFRLKLTN